MDNSSLEDFKNKVKQWLTIDEEINKYESKIKELKKHKKKILEPEITSFMVEHNITNLNTENGLIKCNERRTKKGLNKFSTTLDEINLQLNNRVDTSDLNLYFRELWVANPPHPFRGRRAKLKYVTQYDTEPPSFSFNLSSRIPKNYISFIENKLRKDHNFKNIALKIKVIT